MPVTFIETHFQPFSIQNAQEISMVTIKMNFKSPLLGSFISFLNTKLTFGLIYPKMVRIHLNVYFQAMENALGKSILCCPLPV